MNHAKTLDEELKRTLKGCFNYTEPSSLALVSRVNRDGSVDVKIYQGLENIILYRVPVLKPCYSVGSLNLKMNDKVLVIFEKGLITKPLVVGKL